MRRALSLFAAAALIACAPQIETPQAPVSQTTAPTLSPHSISAFFDCLATRNLTVVSAHRAGPAPGFAENAVETIRHSLAQAPLVLEIDIAKTSDGALVLMHDDTVNRTTNGRGAVSDLTLAQFQALRLRDDDGLLLDGHPPTFAEALAAGRDTIMQLDVKRSVRFEDVIEAVRAAGAQNRVVIITYNDDDALRVQRAAPEMMVSVSMYSEADLARLTRAGLNLAHTIAWTGNRDPNPALNVALQQAGVESIFGTLGPPSESWDGRFARSGQNQYVAFAETGLEMIASDRPLEAARDIDAADGEGPAQCLTAQ